MAIVAEFKPGGDWTPIRNEVFKEVLGDLQENNSSALYLYLCDRQYHSPTGLVAATTAELSRATGIDYRVVDNCMEELQRKRLIRKTEKGIKRSRSVKDQWKVVSAVVDLGKGNWTPIPRNIILNYFPAYRNSVLLPLLIYYQNMRQQNFCWPGVTTLSKRLGWSATTVRKSIRDMSDKQNWKSRYPDLPYPLRSTSVTNDKKQRIRRLSVLAIQYEGQGRQAEISLSRAYRMAFDLI